MPRSAVQIVLALSLLSGYGGQRAQATNGLTNSTADGKAAARPDPRIAAARHAEGDLLAIFPTHFGTAACLIGYGGPVGGVMPGTCTTRLGRLTTVPNYSGQSLIVFTERWRWPPPGKPGTRYAFTHTWAVTLGPTFKVFGVKQRGPIPPQLWR